MPNNIELIKKYVPLLDEAYRKASLTADLDGNPELVREGANANELIIAKMSMDGLANYSRSSGYVDGNVELTWETVKCNYDRGRKFHVDDMDDAETAHLAFGRLAGAFIRDRVAPEIDAFRLAAYASEEGIGSATGALTTGANVITALRAASTAMDEAEVYAENRILYITPTLRGLISDLDTTKSREVLNKFSKIVEVPQSRMYSAVQLKDGVSEDQKAGGFAKADGGVPLNFIIVQKDAVIQFPKHVVPRVFDPSVNQNADAWIYTYRNVGIADVYENKRSGIYVHKTA